MNGRKASAARLMSAGPSIAVLLAGCVTTNTTMLVAPAKYGAVPADSVQVFLSEEEVTEKGYQYERVALIFATGSADFTTGPGMVSKLRKEAGRRGANGIVLRPIKEPTAGAQVAGALLGVPTERKGSVVAIRWWRPADRPER